MDSSPALQTAIDLSDSELVPVPRERAWQALHDPAILAACIPGCRELRRLAPKEYEGSFLIQIGETGAELSGRATVYGQSFPDGWMVAAHANNAAAGWIGGQVMITLAPEDTGTRIAYRARIESGGPLASGGMENIARRLVDGFFARLAEALAPSTGKSIWPADAATTVLAGGFALWVMILLLLFLPGI